MEFGTVLLYVSLVLGLGAIGFTIFYLYFKDDFYLRISRFFSISCSIMVSATFFLLAYYFLASDLHIKYVHSYTQTDYTLFYKWGGILAGADGTLLFWVWLISLSLIVQEVLQYRKDSFSRKRGGNGRERSDESTLFIWIRLIVIIVIIVFLTLIIKVDLFKPTDALSLSYYPDGYGLHSNLHTPLMIAHPPVEFAGYAFTTIPMAAGLAYLITGKGKWTEISLQWARWAWFFYGLGIGIGGMWAYIVLGWGGFWAWDPIETVNLIPYLILTAFIHGQIYTHTRKLFKDISVLLIITTFVLSLLATFVTRSGLWVSVHDFAEVNVKEAGPRLIRILETAESPRFFVVFIFVMLGITAILFTVHMMRPYIKINKRTGRKVIPLVPFLYICLMLILLIFVLVAPVSFVSTALSISPIVGLGNGYLGGIMIFALLMAIPAAWLYYHMEEDDTKQENPETGISHIVNDKNTMLAAILILVLAGTITTLMLFMGVNGMSREVFDSRAPLIVLPLVVLLAVCMVWRSIGRENVPIIVGIMITAGVLGYFFIQEHPVVGFAIPILFIALFASVFKVFNVMGLGKNKFSMKKRLASGLLVISGLLGMLMWGAPPSRVAVLSFDFTPTVELAVVGFLFSSFSIIGGFLTVRTSNVKLAILGGICGLLALGYYIGSILAAIGLALIILSYKEFRTHSPGAFSNRKKLMWDLRRMWTHVIHYGLLLFVIGYVLSSYLVVESTSNPAVQDRFHNMGRDDIIEFDGLEFKFVSSKGMTAENLPGYEIVEVSIEIYRDGVLLSIAKPYMKWAEQMNHYHQFVYVENVVVKDIYFIVRGFFVPGQGWIYSMGGEGLQGVRFASDEVSAVAIELKALPGIVAVWSGFWTMSLGMLFIVIFGYYPIKSKDRVIETTKAPAGGKPDSYYGDMIEKELLKIKNNEIGGTT